MTTKLLLAAACTAALAMMTPVAVGAQTTYDKLTYLTFNATVQVPGAMLPAGTYRFHLTNPATSRNVMQVLSYNGDTVYAMFHTIPDVRLTVTDEAIVMFREVAADVPPPINTLFYGGESIGYEFVYGAGPDLTRRPWPQPPVSYLEAPAFVAPPAAEAPAEPAIEPAPAPAPVEVAAVEPPAEPATLPKTATNVPAVAFGGVLLVAAGLGLAFVRRTW